MASSQHNGEINGQTSKKSAPAPGGTSTVPTAKPSLTQRLKHLWAKTGITLRVYETVFKGALAPTIAIAAYQSNAWSAQYTTIGYLVGVVAVLSLVIQPRAKFIQSMLINIFCSTMGCCISLLACYCAVQARRNTERVEAPGNGGPGTSGTAARGAQTAGYNSSASAVAGVWLFAEIFLISTIRAKMPQWTIPCILWAIFANVSLTYAPQFNTMSQAINLTLSIYEAQLTGFAIATATSLLVFPLTSRQVVFEDMKSFFAMLRGVLDANMAYMTSLEDTDMFAAQRTNTVGEKPARSPEAQKLKAATQALTTILAKLHTDLPFAKREIALGKVGPDDLNDAFKHFREITIPTVGLNVMSDMFDRISEDRGWDRSKSFALATPEDASTETEKFRITVLNEWHVLVTMLKGPFGSITEVIRQGLQHVELVLRLQKPKTTDHDQEAAGDVPGPGEDGFTQHFDRLSDEFQQSKQTMLRAWCKVHGIDLSDDFFTNPEAKDFEAPAWMNDEPMSDSRRRTRRQLMIMLYFEFLLYSISRRVYKAMVYADELKASGKLNKTRLIVPGYKRLRKWIYDELFTEQHGSDDHDNADNSAVVVHLGEGYKQKRDPDHLPPANAFERAGNQLRKVAHFFASNEAHFGFRVAVATMCIAVINELRETQTLFTTHRFFWAQIMVSIGMTPSAGQSLRTYIQRSLGTLAAMALSYVAWYIVDGNNAGVIVFFFIFCHGYIWLMLKYPAILPIGQIGQITMVLILGYELQTRKIGIQQAQSNGQAYYPVYTLAPIRLATVLAGLFVAWIFTIFPYPITEHARLRRNLGSAFYLLANYYSVVHETLKLRLSGGLGDQTLKDSPGSRLDKSRHNIYAKCNILLSSLRAQSAFVKYDIPVGGRFPAENYSRIVNLLSDTLNFMALISTASATFSHLENDHEGGSRWLANLRRIVVEANLTSQAITSVLTLLSASIINKQALPPYVRLPEPYALSQKLDAIDSDVLSVRHIAEPGYASFACIQIVTKNLNDEMKDLLAAVKELVGELDFSYHIVSTRDESANQPEGTLRYTNSRGGKLD